MTVLDTNPDPKPPARIVDRKAFARFYDQAALACQICGDNGTAYGLSIHHLLPRGQGGDDMPSNFALLCGHGTAGCHGDVEAHRNGARSRLRESMTQEQIAYLVAKRGWAWVDRFYPEAA